jgi:hypothetical protein
MKRLTSEEVEILFAAGADVSTGDLSRKALREAVREGRVARIEAWVGDFATGEARFERVTLADREAKWSGVVAPPGSAPCMLGASRDREHELLHDFETAQMRAVTAGMDADQLDALSRLLDECVRTLVSLVPDAEPEKDPGLRAAIDLVLATARTKLSWLEPLDDLIALVARRALVRPSAVAKLDREAPHLPRRLRAETRRELLVQAARIAVRRGPSRFRRPAVFDEFERRRAARA